MTTATVTTCGWKHGRSGDAEKAHESADTPPIALIREEHEAAKAHWSMVVDEAILRHFKADPTGVLHADDLESLGLPAEHRNCIGSQFAKWINRKRMVECGRRASAIPSRNAAKSNEYRLTKKGRDLIAGPDSGECSGGTAPITVRPGEGQDVGPLPPQKSDPHPPPGEVATGVSSPDHLPGLSPSSAYSPENKYA